MNLGKAIDRAIGVFSPGSELRRMRTRMAADLVRLHYEGASMSRRTGGWTAPSTSENAAAWGSLGRLRDRSRDLIRNNAWAASAIEDLEGEIVGSGIVPRPLHKDQAVREKALELWREHCESTEIDSDGRLNIYGLQGLALRTTVESGDVLLRRRRRRPTDGYRLPFQIELLEPDHLDDSRDNHRTEQNGRIQAGIEFDALGARKGYWLLPYHPGDVLGNISTSRFVPASEVLHVYRVKRAKQLRGIPALHAVIIRLRDLDEYEDASLLKQKISACLTAFVTDPAGEPVTPIAGQDPNRPVEDLEPGARVRLGPGEDVRFSDPPASDGFEDFVRCNLRAIAASVGITYEALSGDWGTVNYSSARMGAQKSQRSIERFRWNTLRPQLLDPLWRWFIEAAQLAGELPMEPIGVEWTPPRRSILDPKNDVPGMRDQCRAGLISISEQIRQDGQDPEQVWSELAADVKRLAELDLKVECDPSTPLRGGPPAPDGNAPAAPAAP